MSNRRLLFPRRWNRIRPGQRSPERQGSQYFRKIKIEIVTFRQKQCFFFVKWTDGDYFLDSYLVIWRRLLVACSLRSQEKHLKIFRALRAPCFVSKFSEKTPLCGFWSDDTRIKKLFLLFFPPPLSLLARAARRNFRFFPGIFLLKRSQDEVRSV